MCFQIYLQKVMVKSLLCTTLIFIFLFHCGCQKKLIEAYGYGEIPSAGEDIYDQGFIVQIPENAPSITQRYSTKPDEDDEHIAITVHDGLDIIALHEAPVLAAAPGKVTQSHLTIIRGNRVVIEHGLDEQGQLIRTEYNHLSQKLVNKGETVLRGQQIGTLGMTGLTGGYPHLHYMVTTVTTNGSKEIIETVNPQLYWANGIGKITCYPKNATTTFPAYKMTYPILCR